jgi:outer membrane protein, protease secretion system
MQRRVVLCLLLCALANAGALAAEVAGSREAQASAHSMDLSEAYAMALQNDATLGAVRAATEARSERVPQARAQLLPNLRASASRYRNDLASTSPGLLGQPVTANDEYTSYSRALTLRQPLFRPFQWADLRQANAQRDEAQQNLLHETQNLAVRVATAYLDALAASDQLALALAQKRAYQTQLEAARRRMAAGSGTRTDIDEAQARLDLAVARELEARENVGYTRRELALLTGLANGPIAPLDPTRMPLLPPEPADAEAWIARAEQGSHQMRALQAQRDAAREEVSKQQAGHLPTLDAVAQKAVSLSENVTRLGFRYDQKSIGLELNVPLFAGGYVNSKVREALAEVNRAELAMEATRRDLGVRVYKEFRRVSEGVLRVRALEQAVRSAETALQSTRRSYEGGSRTQVDVLNAEEARVSAVLDLANARYAYLLARITLRALAGEADAGTIAETNGWLQGERQ